MKKYTLVAILSALVLTLLVVIFYLLWNFNSHSNTLPQFATDNDTNQSIVIDDKELTWQEELAQWPKRDFIPATEKFSLYFDADTSELKEKNKYYIFSFIKTKKGGIRMHKVICKFLTHLM